MTNPEIEAAALRMKVAAGEMATNEDETNKGVLEVYKTPAGRSPGTVDAKWGDTPLSDPQIHGSGVLREANEGRKELLGRVFDSMPAASANAKASVGDLFSTKDYASRSTLLGHSKTASSPESLTLSERVRKVAGRF